MAKIYASRLPSQGGRRKTLTLSAEQPDLFTVSANAQGFVVLAKRRVVERTHGWNERARRLIMHHDRLTSVFEAWVWLTEARMLLRRLAT